jgi:hypothetical protein
LSPKLADKFSAEGFARAPARVCSHAIRALSAPHASVLESSVALGYGVGCRV